MTEPTCEQLCDYDDGDESFIAKFENVIGDSGYNPLDYLRDDDGEEITPDDVKPF